MVASATLPSLTTDCCAKPVPVTESGVSGLPALTALGDTETTAGAGLLMDTCADFVRAESAAAVALTVTVFGEGGTAGAV